MADPGDSLQRYIGLQKAVLASLRLKDVLDAVIMQFHDLTSGAKVAIFLSDNDTLALKLLAARGYSSASLDLLKVVPFSSGGILKQIVQQRKYAAMTRENITPDLTGSILKREGSAVQVGIPLIADNLLVGAILLDSDEPTLVQHIKLLVATAELAALSIANSILYSRSDYERAQVNTLYQASIAFSSIGLRSGAALQIGVNTAAILANTLNCVVFLYDPSIDAFEVGAFKGLDAVALNQFDLKACETIIGTTLRTGKTFCCGDSADHPFKLPPAVEGVPFSSAVLLPLICENTPLGVLAAFSTERNAFHREQIDLLESLSRQVANALYLSLRTVSTPSHLLEDVQTGLFSRAHFEQNLIKECERSARHQHEMALLLIDIDHFVRINATFGEKRGDEAIRYVASVIKETLRDMDVICHYGGQEFAVILPETPHEWAVEVGDRLRAKLRAKNAPGLGLLTVSIGVATFPINGEHPPELLESAQQALDVAKYQGRDRVVLAQSGKGDKAGPIAWLQMARQAKFALINEHQTQLRSGLTAAPEYTTWMTRSPGLLKKKRMTT